MIRKITTKIIYTAVLATVAVAMTQCNSSSTPEWQKKNQELIKQHNLTERKLSTLPQSKHKSNLEPTKVTSLDKLISTALYPNVDAKIFWGAGTMGAILQLAPNAKIPEEVLPADRFVFVLEGSIDQLIHESSIPMISQKREAPDGTHSATPRIDFVYSLPLNAIIDYWRFSLLVR